MDDSNADRLLSGRISPDATPAGFEEVARLMAAAAGPGDEATSNPALVAAMAAGMTAVRDPGIEASPRRRRRFTVKVAGVAALAVLLTGTAAAAATNSLPGPAQSAVSDAASTVGVSVPKHHHHGNPHDATLTGTPTSDTGKPAKSGTSHGKGPDAGPTSPATYGLCQAFATVTTADPQSHSTAYRNLAAAAAAAHQTVSAYCATIKPPAAGSDESGTDDQKPATTPGSGSSTPATGNSNANGNSKNHTPEPGDDGTTSTTQAHGPASTGKPSTTPGH